MFDASCLFAIEVQKSTFHDEVCEQGEGSG